MKIILRPNLTNHQPRTKKGRHAATRNFRFQCLRISTVSRRGESIQVETQRIRNILFSSIATAIDCQENQEDYKNLQIPN